MILGTNAGNTMMRRCRRLRFLSALYRQECSLYLSQSNFIREYNFGPRRTRWPTTTTETANPYIQNALRHFSTAASGTWKNMVSLREMAELEDLLSERVGSRVQDPILQQSLAELRWMKKRVTVADNDDGSATLHILLQLPSLLHPSLSALKRNVQQEAEVVVQKWASSRKDLPTVKVNVEALPTKPEPMMLRLVEDHDELLRDLGPGLSSVSHFVAVYSCKGGVGKSTVAVNLAFELARIGGRVGLLDLDIYGPSLPILVQPEDIEVRRSPTASGMVYPIDHRGVKMLSLGFVSKTSGVPGSGQDNGAAIMKGPMAVKVVSQLLKGTDWGNLDVLLLDLPPGTGDVQLAVLQELQLSGAVAVTTPSKLAVTDTRKGIQMFTSLGVPTLSVVENMAYFEDDRGRKHFPFGRGFSESPESTDIVQLPISITANDANDAGRPLTLTRPKGAERELATFETLAKNVSREMLKLQYGSQGDQELVLFEESEAMFDVATVSLSLEKGQSQTFMVRLFSESGAIQRRVAPPDLRFRDPKTGESMTGSPLREESGKSAPSGEMVTVTKAGKTSPSVIPTRVKRRGRYGFAVEWADGATIIYSMRSIARAAGGVSKQQLVA